MGATYAVLMTMQIITIMILIWGGFATRNNWFFFFAVLVIALMIASAKLAGYMRASMGS